MNIHLKATITEISEPKKLSDIYVTDIYIRRESGNFTNYNLLKLFHKQPEHGLLTNVDYNIDVDLRGRKTKDNRVFNELKIITINEA